MSPFCYRNEHTGRNLYQVQRKNDALQWPFHIHTPKLKTDKHTFSEASLSVRTEDFVTCRGMMMTFKNHLILYFIDYSTKYF